MRLSKLGAALTVIFVVCIVALAAELYYVFRRRRTVSAAGDEASLSSSKELLYFFCVKSSSSSSRSGDSTAVDAAKEEENMSEVIDIDLFKIGGGAFGPTPRFLFTIKEEEREGLDSPKEMICAAKVSDGEKSRTSLEECFRAVEVDDDADVESSTTPFSTPYASSPEFLTPSGSPVYEDV